MFIDVSITRLELLNGTKGVGVSLATRPHERVLRLNERHFDICRDDELDEMIWK